MADIYEFPRPTWLDDFPFESPPWLDDDSVERSLLEDNDNTWWEDRDGTRYPPGHPRNPRTPTWLDDSVGCPVCWLGYELGFAADEYGSLPGELDAGIDEMLAGHDTNEREPHDRHGLATPALEAAADAAECIASWRHTNSGPTRPRVVALMERLAQTRHADPAQARGADCYLARSATTSRKWGRGHRT